jgi:hypothetical protein
MDRGRNDDIRRRRPLSHVKGGRTDQIAAPASMTVVQHWGEELTRLVPTT